MKTFGLLLFLMSLLSVFPNSPRAQEPAITDGVNWLVANQDPSGLWGTDKKTPFRDATVVVDVLSTLDNDSAAIANGLDTISSFQTNSTDYLARKIIALASGSGGVVPAYLIDSLADMQNVDSGWAYQRGYGSNVIETALALRALKSASYANMAKLGMGVSYLTSNQNADSGWSFVASDSSMVFFTAHAIITLAALQGDFSVGSQIQGGVNWLKTQDHGDGGFGTSGTSNPYETGLALAAIVKGDPMASEITAAQAYLESTQLPNGSWNIDDAYSTAMAIYGLNHVGPDLAIATSDIVLSNPTPSDSELVTISATVHNEGVQAADTILVQIFDGNPDLGGVQIGSDATIWSLAPSGDSTIQVDWGTYPLAGDHDIYVFVDPLNEIREPDKLNNTAEKSVHVYFPPDLVIDSTGIVFDPLEPDSGDQVFIRVTVKNNGELTATSVPIQIWDGDPYAGGIALIPPPWDTISSIAPGSQAIFNLDMGTDYFTVIGPYEIHACADRDNSIREINEFNNCGFDTLWFGIRSRPIDLYTGLNLLGLPLNPLDTPTSYTIIPEIPSCNEIDGWDRASQMWISAVDIGSGIIIGDEFPIELRDGFFARVTDAGTMNLVGRRVAEHGCTYVEQGLNIVSVPNEDACYTGYTLIDDIDTCVEAHMWDANLQFWESAAKIGEGVFIGEDFPVTPGNGYFVKVGLAGEWCTKTCDTIVIPDLPDLLVTPGDIYLNPNPVVSGAVDTIAVNINNIGNDTAYSPRLDIYAGDPDAGGTLLLGGNLPIDIPPGGASGFWGGEVIAGAPGFVEIYGIADFYNAVEELDETNNQASQTLQIVASEMGPGPLTSRDEGRSDGTPGQFVKVAPNQRPSGLRFYSELTPAYRGTATAPSTSAQKPLEGKLSWTSAAGEIASIDKVTVGNFSNSSVSIAWITDGPAIGCINYGSTSTLGFTKCEESAPGELHTVVLDSLLGNTTYYFEVVCGDIIDNDGGNFYSFTTTGVGAGIPFIIYGHAYLAEDSSAAEGLVYASLMRGGENGSYPLIAPTRQDGVWLLNLGNLKDAVSGEPMYSENGDTVVLEFYGSNDLMGTDTIIVSDTSPQNCGVLFAEAIGLCGDIDASGGVNVADITVLVDYLFSAPPGTISVPLSVGDVDCSGSINVADLTYLVDYFFMGGPAPCADCD